MANILPIVLVGAAAYYLGKKKRKKKNGKQKALGTSSRGPVFSAGEVDVIEAGVGERFSVAIPENPGTGYAWSLEASPPGETVKLVKDEYEAAAGQEGMDGGLHNHFFVFEAKKPGSGALVFHYMRPFEKGQVPPDKVLEIQTKIS
jgi:predicted secreted protein